MEEVKEVGLIVAVAAWIIGSLIALVSLVYLVMTVKLRNTKLIKMSSPNLNCLIASGGLLSSITCLLYGIDYFIKEDQRQLSNFCQLRAAFLVCSFTLLYGPLVAKCWRVNRIFEQGSLKRVVIKDSKLFLLIAGLLCSDVLVMTTWQVIDPLRLVHVATLEKVNFQSDRDNLTVTMIPTCSCNSLSTWLTLIFILKTPLLISSLVLAWKTRDVLIPSMNDSCSIIISTMTTLFVSSAVYTLKSIHQSNPDIVTTVILLGIGVCSIVTTSVVFVPKFILWWKNPEKSALRLSISSKSTSNVTGINTTDIVEDDMFTMVAENISMKKSLQEKDAAIKTLQGHLSNAQQKLMEISLDQEARLDSGLDSDCNTTGQEDSPTISLPSTPPQILQSVSLIVNETPRQPSLKSFSSSSSVVEYNKLCRLRDSIAEDLTLARDLSSNIRSSLTKDIHAVEKCTGRGSFRYDSVQSRQELAGSITQSYNLSNTCDTYDYVSSCVTSSSNLHQACLRSLQYSSSESIEALPNDKLYPDGNRRKKLKRHPRRSEFNRTVYVIPTGQPQVNSAVSLAKSLDTDTFV